jgi:hypothetical protein
VWLGECLACGTRLAAQYEVRQIRKLEQNMDAGPPGAPFLLVSAAWLERWRSFVRQRGPRPGPIDNSPLVRADGTPREGLRQAADYRLLAAPVFHALLARYGGGPLVLRASQDIYDLRPVPPAYDPASGLPRDQ